MADGMLGLLGRVLEDEREKHRAGAAWAASARPNQLPPDGDWFVWLILAGRGWGKTQAAAELVTLVVTVSSSSGV